MLNGANKAPSGQKYLQNPLSTVNINSINKTKIMRAGKKNSGLGTNSDGYNNTVGIVPVRKPTGQISVNIKPITAVVKNTKPINTRYLMYRILRSILRVPIFLTNGNFFNLLATGAVPLCNKPMGHAHPHTALPVSIPKKPIIRRGKSNNFHLKLFWKTLTSNALRGQAEVEAGHELQ